MCLPYVSCVQRDACARASSLRAHCTCSLSLYHSLCFRRPKGALLFTRFPIHVVHHARDAREARDLRLLARLLMLERLDLERRARRLSVRPSTPDLARAPARLRLPPARPRRARRLSVRPSTPERARRPPRVRRRPAPTREYERRPAAEATRDAAVRLREPARLPRLPRECVRERVLTAPELMRDRDIDEPRERRREPLDERLLSMLVPATPCEPFTCVDEAGPAVELRLDDGEPLS